MDSPWFKNVPSHHRMKAIPFPLLISFLSALLILIISRLDIKDGIILYTKYYTIIVEAYKNTGRRTGIFPL